MDDKQIVNSVRAIDLTDVICFVIEREVGTDKIREDVLTVKAAEPAEHPLTKVTGIPVIHLRHGQSLLALKKAPFVEMVPTPNTKFTED